VPDRLGPKFDLLLAAEMERNLPQLHAAVKMFPSASA